MKNKKMGWKQPASKKGMRQKSGSGSGSGPAPRQDAVRAGVAEVLIAHLRDTELRATLRDTVKGAGDDAIERALRDKAVIARVGAAMQAVLFEQTVATLRRILDAAEKGEAWAMKFLLELTAFPDQVRAAVQAGEGAAAGDVFLRAMGARLGRLHPAPAEGTAPAAERGPHEASQDGGESSVDR